MSVPCLRHNRCSCAPAFALYTYTRCIRSSCRRIACCVEVRSVATAPPRFLGPRFLPPRFPGERRDPGTTELWTATKRTSSHQGLCGTERAAFKEPRTPRRRNTPCAEVRSATAAPPRLLGLSLSYLLVFPANAGTQGPPSSGRQPRGHRTAMTSAAQKVLAFHAHPSIVPAEHSLRWRPFRGSGTTVAPGLALWRGKRGNGGGAGGRCPVRGARWLRRGPRRRRCTGWPRRAACPAAGGRTSARR